MSENKDINNSVEETEVSATEVNTEGGKKKIEYDESLFENSTIFGEVARNNKKPKMKPMVKGFILSVSALVVAAVVLTVSLLIPQTDNEGQTSSVASTPTYTVTALKEKDVDTVKVYNKNHPDGYTIVRQEVEEEESSSSSSTSSSSEPDYEWLVQGYEKYNLSGSQYLVSSLLSMTSTKKYTKSGDVLTADDLDITALDFSEQEATSSEKEGNRYGFDKPWSVVTAKGEKVELTVIVGDVAPDKSGRYVTVSGNDNIYVVSESKMSYFNKHFNMMINMAINDRIVNNEGTADYYEDGSLMFIDKVVLGGSCRKNAIRIETPDDDLSILSFVVTEPTFRAGNEEAIANIMGIATTGLMNDGAYVLGYTDADLEEYGLKNPFSTVEMIIGTYKVNLAFGPAREDGYYPCILEGSDIIYMVPKEGNEFVEYTDEDVYYDSLFLERIVSIKSIGVKTDKHDALFELVRKNDDDPSDYTIKCDQAKKGVTIPAQQVNFFYGRLLNLSAETTTDNPAPQGDDAYITITIAYTDADRQPDVIRLYKHSARRYHYTLNGKGNALVASSGVKDLYDCLGMLLNGQEISRN